jgi:cyclophilin family peptidyl-prolyl cis-trans isomerase
VTPEGTWPPPEHGAWQQDYPGWTGRPPYQAPAPGISLTIVITVLFGLFGLIPAALAASQARRTGHPENRYWIAFGVSLAGSVALYVVVVLAGLALLVSTVGPSASVGDAAPTTFAAPSTDVPQVPNGSSTSTPTADGSDGACDFKPDESGNPNLIEVGTPPSEVLTSGIVTLTMTTNAGPIQLTLDQVTAPCASASFVYLAQQQFFDGSTCHREVNQETFGVLQCGDPTGTGSGGPTYKFAEEVTPETTYPRGTIAMANTGQPESTGSQFFLCFSDTQLTPTYTAVGAVDGAGLAVLDRIAAAGNDGSLEPSPGGGAPNTPVVITSMTVRR